MMFPLIMPSGALWGSKTDDGWVLTEEGSRKRYYLNIEPSIVANKAKRISPAKVDINRFEQARWKILTHLSWLTIRWRQAIQRLGKVGKAYSKCKYHCSKDCHYKWSLDGKDPELLATYIDHVTLLPGEEPLNLEVGNHLELINSRLKFYYDWLNALEKALEKEIRDKLPIPRLNGKFKQAKIRINARDYFFEVTGLWPCWQKSFWPTDAMLVLDWTKPSERTHVC